MVVHIRTNLILLVGDLSKYVSIYLIYLSMIFLSKYINFFYPEALIIVYGIRAKLIGVKLGTKHYQELATFM